MSFDKQAAIQHLKRLQECLDEGDGSPAAAPPTGGCGCGSGGAGAVADDCGFAGSPGLDVFKGLARAFEPALTDDPDGQRHQYASSLLLTAATVEGLANNLLELAAIETGARSSLSDALAARLTEAAVAFRSAGAACLSDETAPPIKSDDADAVERALRDAAGLMLFDPATRRMGSLKVFGDGLSKLGTAYADFLRCLADPDHATDVAACYGYVRGLTATTVAGVFESLFFGRRFVPFAPPVCTAECPYLGCTTYCSDVYRNPVNCVAWVRIPPGLFMGGGWEISCTWTIDTVEKIFCCCYASAWDLFWASDGCDCGDSVSVLSTRVGAAQLWSGGLTLPAAPDASTSFTVSISCP